jgi:hypothetical protein
MKFRVGDLVWAKTDKDMMWPAKVLTFVIQIL